MRYENSKYVGSFQNEYVGSFGEDVEAQLQDLITLCEDGDDDACEEYDELIAQLEGTGKREESGGGMQQFGNILGMITQFAPTGLTIYGVLADKPEIVAALRRDSNISPQERQALLRQNFPAQCPQGQVRNAQGMCAAPRNNSTIILIAILAVVGIIIALYFMFR